MIVKTGRTVVSRGVAAILAAALAAPGALALAGCGSAQVGTSAGGTDIAGAGEATTPTKVTGVATKIARERTQRATDKVTVSPAWGRSVELQYLDPASGQWQTQATYQTQNAAKSTVTLDYGDGWKSHAASTWRVHVPAAQVPAGTAAGSAAGSGDAGAAAGGGTTETAAEYAKTVKVRLTDPNLVCKSAVVLDAASGQVIFDYKATARHKIASTTKMITAILLTENKSLDEQVKITKETAKTPWGVGLQRGDTVTVKDLLYSMMLPSANDAAVASGIAVAGSTKAFVQRMDQRAAELGATDTVYQNPNGLDKKGAHSTALDQAKIARYIMTDASTGDIRKAVGTWKKSFKSKKGIRYRLENTDKMLKEKGRYKALGVKTGTTDKAGCCFAGCFNVGGRQIVTVELGAQGDWDRWVATRELVDIASYAGKHNLPTYNLQ